jgi:uncharacterized membrane protein
MKRRSNHKTNFNFIIMATKKKMGNSAKAWGIGGAVTAAAIAAAAGAYLLSDKKTKAKAKAWVVNARK